MKTAADSVGPGRRVEGVKKVKRIVFGMMTAAITIFGAFAASPASAGGRCSSGYSRGYTRTRYVTYREYDGYGYGGSGRYGRYPRYASYGGYDRGGRCSPRRRGYRTTRVYTTYVSAPRYRCGCGQRFASAYWLDYHRDHVHGW